MNELDTGQALLFRTRCSTLTTQRAVISPCVSGMLLTRSPATPPGLLAEAEMQKCPSRSYGISAVACLAISVKVSLPALHRPVVVVHISSARSVLLSPPLLARRDLCTGVPRPRSARAHVRCPRKRTVQRARSPRLPRRQRDPDRVHGGALGCAADAAVQYAAGCALSPILEFRASRVDDSCSTRRRGPGAVPLSRCLQRWRLSRVSSQSLCGGA